MAVTQGGLATFAPGVTPPSVEVTCSDEWTVLAIKYDITGSSPPSFIFYRDSILTDAMEPGVDYFGATSAQEIGITDNPFSPDTESWAYCFVIKNDGLPFWFNTSVGAVGSNTYIGIGMNGVIAVGSYGNDRQGPFATNAYSFWPGPTGEFDPDGLWLSVGFVTSVTEGLNQISPFGITPGSDGVPVIGENGSGVTAYDAEVKCADNPPLQGDTYHLCVFLQLLTFDPTPEPPEDSPLTQVSSPLHIPYKDYASDSVGVALTPYAQHQFLANLKAIESWADQLRCSGLETVYPPELPPYEVEYTPTDGKWKEHQLHIPHKERFSSRNVRENYLAIERWANRICPTLHIPYKDWVLMGGPAQEQVNLLEVERWAREISRCCEGIPTETPPEG